MEYLAPGLIHERSVDGLFATFILNGNTPQTIEAWLAKVRTLFAEWSEQIPCLMLHDLRKIDSYTAMKHFQKQLLATTRPELKLYTALVVDDDTSHPCYHFFTQGQYHRFISRSAALMWLLKQVNP